MYVNIIEAFICEVIDVSYAKQAQLLATILLHLIPNT